MNEYGMVVGIASSGRPVAIDWAMRFAALAYPMGLPHYLCAAKGYGTDVARNILVKYTLDHKAEYLLFLDDDVIPPINGVRALQMELSAHPEWSGIGGIYPARYGGCDPLVFKKLHCGPSYDWKKDEVFEVEGIATGCLLLRASIFKTLPEPWFKVVDKEEQGNPVIMSDDIYFCVQAKKAGLKLAAHGGVLCSHVDPFGKEYTLERWLGPPPTGDQHFDVVPKEWGGND